MTITEARRKYPHISEKIIAYNVLFADADINGLTLEKLISVFNKCHVDKIKQTHRNIDIDLIRKCIANNYNSYVTHPFIASDYSEIDKKLHV